MLKHTKRFKFNSTSSVITAKSTLSMPATHELLLSVATVLHCQLLADESAAEVDGTEGGAVSVVMDVSQRGDTHGIGPTSFGWDWNEAVILTRQQEEAVVAEAKAEADRAEAAAKAAADVAAAAAAAKAAAASSGGGGKEADDGDDAAATGPDPRAPSPAPAPAAPASAAGGSAGGEDGDDITSASAARAGHRGDRAGGARSSRSGKGGAAAAPGGGARGGPTKLPPLQPVKGAFLSDVRHLAHLPTLLPTVMEEEDESEASPRPLGEEADGSGGGGGGGGGGKEDDETPVEGAAAAGAAGAAGGKAASPTKLRPLSASRRHAGVAPLTGAKLLSPLQSARAAAIVADPSLSGLISEATSIAAAPTLATVAPGGGAAAAAQSTPATAAATAPAPAPATASASGTAGEGAEYARNLKHALLGTAPPPPVSAGAAMEPPASPRAGADGEATLDLAATRAAADAAKERVSRLEASVSLGQQVRNVTASVPPLTEVFAFLQALTLAGKFSPQCNLIALVYINRLVAATGLGLHAGNWRPLVLSALLLAQKVWDDRCLGAKEFAVICPLFTPATILRLERKFLKGLSYNVTVGQGLYAQYYFELRALSDDLTPGSFPLEPLSAVEAKRLEVRSEIGKRLPSFAGLRGHGGGGGGGSGGVGATPLVGGAGMGAGGVPSSAASRPSSVRTTLGRDVAMWTPSQSVGAGGAEARAIAAGAAGARGSAGTTPALDLAVGGDAYTKSPAMSRFVLS